jgi:hypothetical protein
MFEITFFEKKFVWAAHPAQTGVTLEDLTEGDAVFVSGKLMDPEFVRNVTGRYVPFTAAVARDYCRGERGRGKNKVLLLQPKPGSMVLGVLLLKLTQADKDALDEFEQVPEVREKVSVRVTIGAHERPATTFLLKE